MNSTISVIITCYSEGELIFDAVKSVLAQSLPATEIILVNDASTDPSTVQACQTLENNSQIRVIWQSQNGGTSAARNAGVAAAQGEILVLLDADDLLPPTALEAIWRGFERYPDAGFVYGSYLKQVDATTSVAVDPGDISLQHMLSSKGLSPSSQWNLIGTTPLRRSLWESIGGYDTSFGVDDLHDVEFWIRAIASGCQSYHLPETLYIWRKYLGSNSRRVTVLSWYRIAQKHFDLYCQIGLNYRAYELLLLGSKWLNQPQAIQAYSRQLVQCILQGRFKSSTLMALLIPTPLLVVLAKRASKHR